MTDDTRRWRAFVQACRKPVQLVYHEAGAQPVPDYMLELLRNADERISIEPAGDRLVAAGADVLPPPTRD
jgi:hypothetical protein